MTCSSACTKQKYKEKVTLLKPEMIYYFSLLLGFSAYFHSTMIVLAWLCRDKNTPSPNMEEKLMMEVWCLFKNEEEGSLPLHFSLTIKLWPTKLSGRGTLLFTYLQASQGAQTNKLLLRYHFASHRILSELRHKELELLECPKCHLEVSVTCKILLRGQWAEKYPLDLPIWKLVETLKNCVDTVVVKPGWTGWKSE